MKKSTVFKSLYSVLLESLNKFAVVAVSVIGLWTFGHAQQCSVPDGSIVNASSITDLSSCGGLFTVNGTLEVSTDTDWTGLGAVTLLVEGTNALLSFPGVQNSIYLAAGSQVILANGGLLDVNNPCSNTEKIYIGVSFPAPGGSTAFASCAGGGNSIYIFSELNDFASGITLSASAPATLCLGSDLSLLASGAVLNGSPSFSWTGSGPGGFSYNSTSANSTVPGASFTTTGTYSFTARITDALGFYTEQSFTVDITAPIATLTSSNGTILNCSNPFTILEATGGATVWTQQGVFFGTANPILVTYFTSGPITYGVTVTDGNGCSASTEIVITMDNPPAQPTNLACYETATFDYGLCQWEVSGTQPIPSFIAVGPYCSGDAIPNLPSVSTNGIAGSWSPAINNLETTLYTFTPNLGECSGNATMIITIQACGDEPENDEQCGALEITNSGQTDLNTYAFLSDMSCNNPTGNNTFATADAEGTPCDGTQGRSMWYTFTTPMCDVNGAVPFEIELSTNNTGTDFNTKLSLFSSPTNTCSDLVQVACNDDNNGAGYASLCGPGDATSSTVVSSTLMPSTQYWVKVDGLNIADAGNFIISGRALAPSHGVTTTGAGTQIQLTATNMGAALYTYYYKLVGSTGYSTMNRNPLNNATPLTDVRTLAPGNDYITQIMYRCDANFFNQSQWYRTAPQTISLELTCAIVSDMTCAYNGDNTYTLSWTEPAGDLYTDGGLSGYRIKRNPVGSTGVYTFSNPTVVCNNGTCSVTLPGNSPTGFNWTIETRCSSNTFQVGNTTDCGPAPEMTLGNDANNNTDKSMQHTFSFVNAEAGIEFVDVQMHDAYADFGLNTPMIGDYEIFVNDNNEITWRRVETTINMNFDFVIVPNPSNAMTTVHLNTVVEAGTFTIVDAMGRTINSGAINNTDIISIDAAQLQSGVYMVVVTVGNQKMTRRLVVAN